VKQPDTSVKSVDKQRWITKDDSKRGTLMIDMESLDKPQDANVTLD